MIYRKLEVTYTHIHKKFAFVTSNAMIYCPFVRSCLIHLHKICCLFIYIFYNANHKNASPLRCKDA